MTDVSKIISAVKLWRPGGDVYIGKDGADTIISALEREGLAIEKAIHPDPPQAQATFSNIELLELIQSLLRSQIREERINSIEELYGFLKEVDTHLAVLRASQGDADG